MAATATKKTTKRPTPARAAKAPEKAAEPVQVVNLNYTVEDDVFKYTTKAGHDLVIDLDFPADLLKLAMGKDEEDRPEEEQFDIMARTFGDNFQDAYAVMGVLERKRLQKAIFMEFAKAMAMPLGESVGSSRS